MFWNAKIYNLFHDCALLIFFMITFNFQIKSFQLMLADAFLLQLRSYMANAKPCRWNCVFLIMKQPLWSSYYFLLSYFHKEKCPPCPFLIDWILIDFFFSFLKLITNYYWIIFLKNVDRELLLHAPWLWRDWSNTQNSNIKQKEINLQRFSF